jgi:basic membrane lipoprotein Med (substrate-binding protein (PBP1-ABC) superfamily)
VLVVSLALAVPACRRSAPSRAPSFKVSLLTSLPVSGRWEREAERGLGRIAAQLGGEVRRVRVGDETSGRRFIGEQGRAGTDLVFCVGAGFEKALYADAAAYPDTVYVLLPGRAHGANLGSIVFLPEEAGYLAGAVSEALAPESVGGLLRGDGGPWLEQLERGFAAGFRSRRPDGDVATAEGVDGVAELTSIGVLVALYSSDRAEPSVLAAARETGLLLIATDPQLMAAEPGLVVATVDIDVAEAMLRVAREVRDGVFTGRVFAFDLGSEVLDVRVSDHLEPAKRQVALEALERARSEITAGFVEIEGMGL